MRSQLVSLMSATVQKADSSGDAKSANGAHIGENCFVTASSTEGLEVWRSSMAVIPMNTAV
jgi:hypothetical protein